MRIVSDILRFGGIMQLKTPISYYGGKQQLSSVILSLLPPHKAYNEPFFGGGAIFFCEASM